MSAGAQIKQGGTGGAGKAPFLAFVSDEKDAAVLREFAQGKQWLPSSVQVGNAQLAAQYLRANPSPAVLLVEITDATSAAAELDMLADVCDPDTKVIIIGDVNEYSFFCWLQDIGISSYLLRPLAMPALEGTYQKATTPVAQAPKAAKEPGRVIGVMGTRGGVGATTLAIALAGIAADRHEMKTVLVDLDPQDGSIALELDLEPGRGLRDALEKPDRIDSLFIERVISRHHKNLAVLSAEESMQELVHYNEQAAGALLKELRDAFDIVILDIPRHPNAYIRQAMKQAENVVLVTELNLSGLRDALRISDLFRETLKMKPPVLVANRTGLASKYEISNGDFEKGCNLKIAHKIPFAPDVFMSVNSELVVNAHKNTPAIKAVQQVASLVLPSMDGSEEAQKNDSKARFSLFKKKG